MAGFCLVATTRRVHNAVDKIRRTRGPNASEEGDGRESGAVRCAFDELIRSVVP
jgi:hypothetical protein